MRHESHIGILPTREMERLSIAEPCVSIELAVPLFDSAGIPRAIIMQQKPCRFLEVQTFAGRVGCEENSNLCCWVVEGLFDLFTCSVFHTAKQAQDAITAVGIMFAKSPLKVIQSCFRIR